MSPPPPLLLLLLLLLPPLLLAPATARLSGRLGINYGQLGTNLPSPSSSSPLLLSLNTPHVKLYDANPLLLSSLSSSIPQLLLSPMLPNQLIPSAASNFSFAQHWVDTHLLPFRTTARLRFLLVGNEILSDLSIQNSTWPFLVPAMSNLRTALAVRSMRYVKLGTTLAMDALSASFPPSSGAFRDDIAATIIPQLLHFLHSSRSFYFVDAYPYFVWAQNPQSVKLNYALLDPSAGTYTDPVTKLVYKNMLEQQLDAVAAAMARLGYPQIPIVVAETGWPNAGDYDEIGANVRNAATYNRNLARWVAAGGGTPARPGKKVAAFVFALFNENAKPGRGTERHWGVFYPNGTAVYGLDLTGRTPDGKYPPLPEATNNEPYTGKIWCVAAAGAGSDAAALGGAVAYACGQGNGTCDAIRKGRECFLPDTPLSHASYAFNSYWQQFRRVGGTCFFNGLAQQTIIDPSYGSCRYSNL